MPLNNVHFKDIMPLNVVQDKGVKMLKTLITLMRGGVAKAAEDVADRNALLILDQQIRDGGAAFDRAKKALAVAIGQDRQEAARISATTSRIADLEQRVIAALAANDEDAAREGAETLAVLEGDRDAAQSARSLFAAEIMKLRRHVTQAQVRLGELDRGRRIARASEAVRDLRRGRVEDARPYEATLAEAETTLKRLRERQMEADAADQAFDELDGAATETVTERLAAKGYGNRLRPSPDAILERLRAAAA